MLVHVYRRLEVAEAKHDQLLEEKRAMEADFKQVLSQYDIEFEDKGDQMAAQLQQVSTGLRIKSYSTATGLCRVMPPRRLRMGQPARMQRHECSCCR